MAKNVILIIFTILIPFGLSAQGKKQDERITQLLEEAKTLNQEGKYEEANVKFRQILSLNKVIPSEMCYHFAETLFAIGQYQNSKNFIEKYFELTGEAGDNYKEVKNLQKMVDDKLLAIRECHRCNTTGYRYRPCSVCEQKGEIVETCYYCKGRGISTCQKCDGQGVLISATAFGGNNYHTCDRCGGDGLETCPICNGDRVLKDTCPTCHGFLFEAGTQICDHQDHPEEGFVVPNVFDKSSN